MTETSLWMIVPGNPGLSALIVFVIAMPFLYAARRPVHELVRAVGHLAGGPLRLASKWLLAVAKEMRERNRQVLLAHGREETEQHIAREFERIGALVRRDLEGYPALQRRLLDEITRVEEDYKKCGEVPPPPPEWVEAVDAVAKVKNGNELVQRVLEEINRSIKTIYDRTLGEYREAYESRHKILNGFMPFWRSLQRTLAQADTHITSLSDRATHIDAQMDKYQEIVKKTDRAEHVLTISALTQFAVALLVLLVAAGGALINYKLIALPMSEMVGAGDYLTASLRTSDVAALVIIFVEATMGLFLMETLRITHLFPGIHNLSDVMRKRLMWLAFGLLVTLAGIEAALALMRDMLIADKAALLQSLSSVQQHQPTDGWLAKIPTAGQMLLGFILPFALAFIAIPLESFVASARTVGGAALVMLARGAAFALRLVGNLVRGLARVVVTFYDVVIVLPLLVERLIAKKKPAIDVDDEDLAVRRR
ncbi:MAG: hypothetical protein QOD26_45 [Betaproteobacteria bacterium]|jgi:hypothetical protein|nr:hypothetical protein [Betaproteobacteria bacterium]